MKKLKVLKIIAIVLFFVSLFCTIDLGLNFLYNTDPSALGHDGSYISYSILHGIFGIFGDGIWSFEMFFLAFKNSAWVTFMLMTVNVLLRALEKKAMRVS